MKQVNEGQQPSMLTIIDLTPVHRRALATLRLLRRRGVGNVLELSPLA